MPPPPTPHPPPPPALVCHSPPVRRSHAPSASASSVSRSSPTHTSGNHPEEAARSSRHVWLRLSLQQHEGSAGIKCAGGGAAPAVGGGRAGASRAPAVRGCLPVCWIQQARDLRGQYIRGQTQQQHVSVETAGSENGDWECGEVAHSVANEMRVPLALAAATTDELAPVRAGGGTRPLA